MCIRDSPSSHPAFISLTVYFDRINLQIPEVHQLEGYSHIWGRAGKRLYLVRGRVKLHCKLHHYPI